jgi:bifunctional UDP-N-acetylglucosamine pyrophosphorylase/glucosamine-1-phosphate N-acetyltransferase
MDSLKCLVLAAGDGTRMLPLTARTAKPLLKVAGRPFVVHTLEVLRGAGVDDIAVLVGWQKEAVIGHFAKADKDLRPTFLEQEERLGTADAIGKAEPWAKGRFLCVNGDVLPPEGSIKRLLKEQRKDPSSVIMTCARVKDPTGYGVVEMGPDGVVTALVEKPERPSGECVNAGIYAFPKDIFDEVRETPMSRRGEFEITTTFQRLMAQGRLRAVVMEEPWIEVTYPWDLLRANAHLMQGLEGALEGKVEEGVHTEGPVVVREGAHVRSGTYIIGPAIIDSDARVGPNAFIRPSTYIGRGCHVGAACELKNTILNDGSDVPHLNYVGDSVIMEGCNLGAGTKVANLRLDEGPVPSTSKGRRVVSGLRKLGAIIGPGVKVGINCSIDAGTVISEDAFIGPGARVRGFVAPRARIH